MTAIDVEMTATTGHQETGERGITVLSVLRVGEVSCNYSYGLIILLDDLVIP